jgi:hypothetical protein
MFKRKEEEMMPEVLVTSEEMSEVKYRPISQIYKDYLASIGITDVETSILDDVSLSDGDIVKNLNTLIELIMNDVSENSARHMLIRNTARLFSYILNGEDTTEPGFEEILDKDC